MLNHAIDGKEEESSRRPHGIIEVIGSYMLFNICLIDKINRSFVLNNI